MKNELLVLWGLLFVAASLSLNSMMVIGDSKVMIDSTEEEANLNILHLGPWKEKMWRLKHSFERLKFMHLHRIYNIVADQLSKKALNCSYGWIYFEKLVQATMQIDFPCFNFQFHKWSFSF
jgi:hypothetical protein